MNNIELYIDGNLCDTGRDFGVRLNRQLLNPSELNAKDAQYSYSVTLPPTAANNAIFAYAIVEETKDKFNRLYLAELLVNSVRVFKGNFKLSEVSTMRYKGNLYIPAAKSIKDVFGDAKLTENLEYRIEFKDFAEYITKYNRSAADGPQIAIFPYVLYGVLPKVPLANNNNNYSARDVWDDTVRMGMADLAPSINPLLMLKHIFESKGFKLRGTAFDDERLTRLYMSYKNESDYVQPWNYGQQAYIKMYGSWSNVRGDYNIFERNGYETDRDGRTFYSSDLFDATNNNVTIRQDTGANVLKKIYKDASSNIYTSYQVRIPASGFYKIRLKADLLIDSRKNWRDGYDGMQFVGGNASDDDNANGLTKKRYELKLLRDRGTGDFGLSAGAINRNYYRANLNQNNTWDEDNTPKYFPNPGYTTSGKECEVLLVDPAENPNYLVGLVWGNALGSFNWGTGSFQYRPENNPLILSPSSSRFATVLAAKSGLSWDISANPAKPTKLGLPTKGYKKWGRLGQFNDEDEDPNKGIDFSGGDWVTDKDLDANGNLVSLAEGKTVIILSRFQLSSNSKFHLTVPTDAGYVGKIFLHDSAVSSGYARAYNFNDEGVADFNSLSWSGPIPNSTYLTLYLAYDDGEIDGVNFDVSETLKINRNYDPEDIIDWEDTNRYKMEIKNAPESYARKSASNPTWAGDGEVNAVVWLEAGETITLASTSDEGRYKRTNSSGKYGWTKHAVNFELDISPFRIDDSWLKVNTAGTGTAVMDWADPLNFDTDSIDLVKFLPADVKIDDFIENFCKAFNLRLSQTDVDAFTLDVKQTKAAVSPLYIDLDGLASVKERSNSPLGLPSLYKIGFTVDQEEEGYVVTGDDGGGSFETGAVEESIVEQKSNFSYNWLKDISKIQTSGNVVLPLPIISKAEVWAPTMPYPEAMAKRFTSLAARFWYFDGLLNDLGADFIFNKNPISIAKVSNSLTGIITLNYKGEINTILDAFFTILVNSSSHYTDLEGYLTPEQYERLDGAIMAMFNGDQYYVAEISGYDPLGKNKTKIKLIRKI